MAISRFSLGVSLSVPLVVSVTSVDNLGVMSNNSRAVMNLLGHLVALLCHDILAVFHVGRVNHGVVLGVADLVLLCVANLVVFCVASLVVFSVASSVGC